MYKNLFPLLIMISCILMPSLLIAGDYDGRWSATVTRTSSTCKRIGRAIEGNYEAVIEHKEGETLTLTVSQTGTVFHGIKLQSKGDDDPHLIRLVASYLEEAGIISQNMTITMKNSAFGSGSTDWNWSDGLMICGGHYTFTLERR